MAEATFAAAELWHSVLLVERKLGADSLSKHELGALLGRATGEPSDSMRITEILNSLDQDIVSPSEAETAFIQLVIPESCRMQQPQDLDNSLHQGREGPVCCGTVGEEAPPIANTF
eukprot:SAG31_NODE_2590_length_5426_cov_4.118265_7_plen_116_part_00